MRKSFQLAFATNATVLLFSILTSLLSAWALGPDGRGDFVIITTWLFVFSMIGTLGLPVAHRYWMAREPRSAGAINTNTMIVASVGSAVTFAAGWVLVPLVLRGQRPEIIWFTQLYLLNIPVILFTEMARGQLEGAKFFGWIGIARVSFITFQAVSFGILYCMGRLDVGDSLLMIIIGQLICMTIMMGAVAFKIRPKLTFDFHVLLIELHYGIRSYLGSLTEFAVWRLDQMMLTALAEPKMVGLYAVAVAISEIMSSLASSVSDALMPEVAGSREESASVTLLGKSLRLTFYAQVIALVPIWMLEPYLLGYIFGPGFLEASGALRLLLVASVLWSAGQICISGLNGFGHPGLGTIARVTSAATTVMALVPLLPVLGIMGAALASIIGYGVMFLVALGFLLKVRNVGVVEFLKPRKNDISFGKLRSIIRFPIVREAGADA